MSAGVASSFASLCYQSVRESYGYKTSSLGASGAINGLVVLYACLNPYSEFLVFFVPVPARIAASLFVGYDLISAIFAPRSKIDNAGHLGGAFYGYYYFKRALFRK